MLEINRGLSAQSYDEALELVRQHDEARAAPTQIAKALAVLTAVCAKPGDFDDAKVVLWSERLKQVLGEFPGDIAMAAIAEWPQAEGGKWWPTENEIRAECEHRKRFRARLVFELEQEAALARLGEEPKVDAVVEDGMAADPVGATAQYVKRLGAFDDARISAYLKNARYGFSTIGIRGSMAGFTMDRIAPGLLRDCGVRIVAPKAFDANGNVVEWER